MVLLLQTNPSTSGFKFLIYISIKFQNLYRFHNTYMNSLQISIKFLNFWQISHTQKKILIFLKHLLQSEKRRGYEVWIETLLSLEFFGICLDHKFLRKNEKNVFCIDCNVEICRHCCNTETHFLHRRLQICKYVYQDVLRLFDIQHYFDCSEIQVFFQYYYCYLLCGIGWQ